MSRKSTTRGGVASEARRERAATKRDYTDEDLYAIARSAALSETLLRTYCTLRELESDLFGDGSPRARYEVMGALMVAMDVANAQSERLDAGHASPEPAKAWRDHQGRDPGLERDPGPHLLRGHIVGEIERIEHELEQLQSNLTPEMQESFGPALEEARQAMEAMRLSATVAGDAREALELSASLV
jgi:hypothetical protein